MHVDVGRVGLVGAAEHLLAAQHRHQGQRLVAAQPPRLRRHGLQHRASVRPAAPPARAGDEQRAARRQERVLGKAVGRLLEEGAAGQRQRAHLRRAVAGHEQRRRAAGAVVAGLRFALQQRHAAVRREPVADRRRGDAAADDDAVCGAGHVPMLMNPLIGTVRGARVSDATPASASSPQERATKGQVEARAPGQRVVGFGERRRRRGNASRAGPPQTTTSPCSRRHAPRPARRVGPAEQERSPAGRATPRRWARRSRARPCPGAATAGRRARSG